VAPDSASALMAFREARQGKSLTAEQAEMLTSCLKGSVLFAKA
jgi:hypothetical protein